LRQITCENNTLTASSPPKAKRPGRPKKSSSDAPTKNIIAKAALKIFCDQGYEGAKIATIAKAAGVVTPAVHYHFDGKLGLWKAAIDLAFSDMEIMRRSFEENLQDLDLLSQLKVSLRNYVRYTLRMPEHIRILYMEAMRDNERSRWLVEHYIRPLHESVKKQIEELQSAGIIKKLSPLTIDSMLGGSVVAVITNCHSIGSIYGIEELTEEQISEHTNAILEILFNGMLDH